MLYEWLDVARLTARSRFKEHSAGTFSAVLDLSEQLAAREFVPHNRAADLREPVIGADGRVVLNRDNRLNQIHEGTHGVQGLDLLDPPTATLRWPTRRCTWRRWAKRAAARYFFHYELPRTDHQFDLLCRFDRTTVDLAPEWL